MQRIDEQSSKARASANELLKAGLSARDDGLISTAIQLLECAIAAGVTVAR